MMLNLPKLTYKKSIAITDHCNALFLYFVFLIDFTLNDANKKSTAKIESNDIIMT